MCVRVRVRVCVHAVCVCILLAHQYCAPMYTGRHQQRYDACQAVVLIRPFRSTRMLLPSNLFPIGWFKGISGYNSLARLYQLGSINNFCGVPTALIKLSTNYLIHQLGNIN